MYGMLQVSKRVKVNYGENGCNLFTFPNQLADSNFKTRLNARSALARKLQNVGFALLFFYKIRNKKVLRPNKKGLRWSSFRD